jgi:hypothetical protein
VSLAALQFALWGLACAYAGPVAAAGAAGELSLQERIACHASIEEVYWRHRAAPGQLPPQPFAQAVPAARVQRLAEDALGKSAALERYWKLRISAAQLQAELDRMAASSRSPGVLAELFDALGGDARLAAECLARPVLADRLLQALYARDDRIHGALRLRARTALAAGGFDDAEAEERDVTWVSARRRC